jgi:hypothetical protein
MHREHAQPVLRCLALSEHLQSRPTCSTRPSRDYRARSMHSQSHFRKPLNLRRNGDFWQQIGKVHSPTRRNGVICPPTKRSDVYVSQSAYSGNCSGSDIGRRDGFCAFDRHRLRRRPLSSRRGELMPRCLSLVPKEKAAAGLSQRRPLRVRPRPKRSRLMVPDLRLKRSYPPAAFRRARRYRLSRRA